MRDPDPPFMLSLPSPFTHTLARERETDGSSRRRREERERLRDNQNEKREERDERRGWMERGNQPHDVPTRAAAAAAACMHACLKHRCASACPRASTYAADCLSSREGDAITYKHTHTHITLREDRGSRTLHACSTRRRHKNKQTS